MSEPYPAPMVRPVLAASLGALALCASLAGAARAAGPSGIAGLPARGMQIANLHPTDAATLHAAFLGPGVPPNVEIRPGVPACSTLVSGVGPPAELDLSGWLSLRVTSEGGTPVGAIARADWHATGAAIVQRDVAWSTDVVVPLVVKGWVGQSSVVHVVNPADSEAAVTIDVLRAGSTEPARSIEATIGPRDRFTLDVAKSADLAGVPAPFLGAARISSDTAIAATSFIDISQSAMAAYGVEGVPADLAEPTLFAPLFRREWFGNTGISVYNPNDAPVDVSVTYAGTGGTCTGRRMVQGPVAIAAGSNAVFYQGPGDVPLTGENGLPDGCFGAARIDAEGGDVLAIVNDAAGPAGTPTTSASNRALGIGEAAEMLLLPLVRNQHTGFLLTTGIQVMNPGDLPAEVAVTIKGADGSALLRAEAVAVAPGAAANWWPQSIAGWRDLPGVVGSAVIESDQPVLAIVNDTSLIGATDAATYEALPCRTDGPSDVALP